MDNDQYKTLLMKSMAGKRMILMAYNKEHRESKFRKIINKFKVWFNNKV
jgi:hypothetical protein